MVRQPNGQKQSRVPFHVMFGATSSLHIFGATAEAHQGYDREFKAVAQVLLEDTYVDDIQGGRRCGRRRGYI